MVTGETGYTRWKILSILIYVVSFCSIHHISCFIHWNRWSYNCCTHETLRACTWTDWGFQCQRNEKWDLMIKSLDEISTMNECIKNTYKVHYKTGRFTLKLHFTQEILQYNAKIGSLNILRELPFKRYSVYIKNAYWLTSKTLQSMINGTLKAHKK